MRAWAFALTLLVAIGCASVPPAPTAQTSSSGGITVSGAPVDCGEFADRPELCRAMALEALDAVKDHSISMRNIWLTTRVYCFVTPECLFDPGAPLPLRTPPFGGFWIGSAEVAFVDDDDHAGISLAQIGDAIVSKQVAYQVPPPAWCSGGCASSAP